MSQGRKSFTGFHQVSRAEGQSHSCGDRPEHPAEFHSLAYGKNTRFLNGVPVMLNTGRLLGMNRPYAPLVGSNPNTQLCI